MKEMTRANSMSKKEIINALEEMVKLAQDDPKFQQDMLKFTDALIKVHSFTSEQFVSRRSQIQMEVLQKWRDLILGSISVSAFLVVALGFQIVQDNLKKFVITLIVGGYAYGLAMNIASLKVFANSSKAAACYELLTKFRGGCLNFRFSIEMGAHIAMIITYGIKKTFYVDTKSDTQAWEMIGGIITVNVFGALFPPLVKRIFSNPRYQETYPKTYKGFSRMSSLLEGGYDYFMHAAIIQNVLTLNSSAPPTEEPAAEIYFDNLILNTALSAGLAAIVLVMKHYNLPNSYVTSLIPQLFLSAAAIILFSKDFSFINNAHYGANIFDDSSYKYILIAYLVGQFLTAEILANLGNYLKYGNEDGEKKALLSKSPFWQNLRDKFEQQEHALLKPQSQVLIVNLYDVLVDSAFLQEPEKLHKVQDIAKKFTENANNCLSNNTETLQKLFRFQEDMINVLCALHNKGVKLVLLISSENKEIDKLIIDVFFNNPAWKRNKVNDPSAIIELKQENYESIAVTVLIEQSQLKEHRIILVSNVPAELVKAKEQGIEFISLSYEQNFQKLTNQHVIDIANSFQLDAVPKLTSTLITSQETNFAKENSASFGELPSSHGKTEVFNS